MQRTTGRSDDGGRARRLGRRLTIATVVLCCDLSGLMAQQPVPVDVGRKIRIVPVDSNGPVLIGQVLAVWGDSLLIPRKRGSSVVVHRASVSRIDVSTGTRSGVSHGIKVGALIGAAGGAGFAILVAATTKPCSEVGPTLETCSTLSAGRVFAAIGLSALTGALIGFEHGSRHPRDTWAPGHWGDGSTVTRRVAVRFGLAFDRARPAASLGIQLALHRPDRSRR